jgi:ankyrin repeat protein
MLRLTKFFLCGLMPLLSVAQTPHDTTGGGFSPLMTAALTGSLDDMRHLIDQGANVNYADADSLTALWLAIPDSAKTELLLQHGANPSLLSKDHYSPLVKLVNFPGTTGLFRDLVAHGADPKKAAPDNSLLYMAAATGDTALVGLLLRYGFLPNDTVSYGDYPLNSATTYRTFPTIKMLIDNGANPNVALPKAVLPNIIGMTPLMLAAVADDERSFNYLLDHGADVNARSATGYTALMYLELSETDHPALTKALLDHGANPREKDKNGDDAYAMASKKGNTASAQLLKR